MTRILGKPQGYAASVPLKLVIREEVPYRSPELGISPGVYEATWSAENNRWEAGGAELNVVMPRWDQADPIPLGSVSIFISRTDTGAVVGKYVYSPAEWVETGPGVFDLGKGAAIRAWFRTQQINDLTASAEQAARRADGAAQSITDAQLNLSAERRRVEQALADVAQSAQMAETAAANLASIATTAGQQAADAATGRIDAAVAQVVSGQALDGVVDTQAQLPAGQPSGTEYTVRSTGTVWRYDGSAWVDTGLGARPAAELYATTTGLALKKARDGGGPVVVLRGHSLMYGQDTVSADKQAASNSSGLTRSKYPTTDVYRELLGLMQPAVQVVDQSFPGDQTKHALTRWANAPVGDLMFVWLDTNDANNYNGDAAGPATIPDTQKRYAEIIRRASNAGAQVIAVGGAPINDLVVGAVNGLSAGPISQNVRAYWAAEREVALRAGAAAVLDIAEVLQEYGYNRWTDGIHFASPAYVEVACSMAALSGPYGVTPPKTGPGARISPLQRAHWGGAVVVRGGSTDNTVIRLQAGESCWLPVLVTDPCELHLDLFADPEAFDGTADIVYALNRVPGKASKRVVMQNRAHGITPVRGHAYASGPRLVQVKCLTGTVEIDGFRFVAKPALLQQPVGPDAPRLYRSQLAGQTMGYGNGWAGIADPSLPVTTLTGSGNPSAARFRLSALLPDDGTSHGLLLMAAANPGAAYLIRSGYMVFRAGAQLYVREWQRDSPTRTVSLGDKFAAGAWSGTMDVVIDGQTLTVYLDGVQAGQIDGVLYRHYWPGVVTEGIYTVRALSVETL